MDVSFLRCGFVGVASVVFVSAEMGDCTARADGPDVEPPPIIDCYTRKSKRNTVSRTSQPGVFECEARGIR